MYSVYIHINIINNKKYIGITALNPEKRFRKGAGYIKNSYFYSEIKKYGWEDGFKHIIYATGLTKEDACNLEIELIAKYNTANRKFGYNLSTGGEIPSFGCKRNLEVREKLSNAHKGKPRSIESIERFKNTISQRTEEKKKEIGDKISRANKGKKMSASSIEKTKNSKIGKARDRETKEKISKTLKNYFKNNNISEETRRKLSDKAKLQWQNKKNKN